MTASELAVRFFSGVLEECDEFDSIYYTEFLDHLQQANRRIRNFMKWYYPGDQIKHFFEEQDQFFVSSDGYVFLSDNVEDSAVDFVKDLFEGSVLGLIHYTDLEDYFEGESYITKYIEEVYPDELLLEFFEQHQDVFSVTNGYICLLYERDLISEEKEAVEYVSEVLQGVSGELDHTGLQEYIQNQCEATFDIIDDCYDGDDFLYFLEKYDDVFFIDDEGLIYLKECVEEEAVGYFEDIFINKRYGPIHYISLYGHIGQAPSHIIKYINKCYGRKRFLRFLEIHNDIFLSHHEFEHYISYIGDEAVKYFTCVLEDYDIGPHYSNLRGHIGQAPRHVINFINSRYPDENFLNFIVENEEFTITDDGYVSIATT